MGTIYVYRDIPEDHENRATARFFLFWPQRAILIDGSAIVGDSDTVVVDASENEALQLTIDPTSGAQQLVSMFQTNSTALLATRWFGFELIRSSGVAVLTGAAW